MASRKTTNRLVKLSALGNVPKGADKDTQSFLDQMRTELIRVSGMAAEALANGGTTRVSTTVAAAATDTGSGSLKQNGWWNFPGGLQVRWGRVQVANGENKQVTFAEKFSNECLIVLAGGTSRIAGNAQDNPADAYTRTEPTTSGFRVTTSIDGGTLAHYIAIGY